MMRSLGLALLLASPACTATDVFTCQTDDECLDGEHAGLCQPEGYCSFPDDSCDDGHRFGEHAGPLAGMCVGASRDSDGPVTSTGGASNGVTTTPGTGDPTDADAETSSLLPDMGVMDDTGDEPPPPDLDHGPCTADCPDPCFVHSSRMYGSCAETCQTSADCDPFFVDGRHFQTLCSADVGSSTEVCVIPCFDPQDCPLDSQCVETFGPVLSICLWPL